MKTTILAYVIALGGLAMIALGLWGLYILMVGELRLRNYILTIKTIGNLEQYWLSAISALAERAVAALVPR